jgi:hypothetical protein
VLTRRRFVLTGLAAAGCATTTSGLYDAEPLDDFAVGRCAWSRRAGGQWVYQENEHLRAFFEAGDLAAYRRAIPARFAIPERPLVRVSVLDFYEMLNGPTYLESEVSVLAVHDGEPGWFLLTMPVTDGDACIGGRSMLGTPKVMRRVTLERGIDRYVGTSYTRGGRVPEFTLTLDVVEPGEAARELIRFVRPFPDLTLLGGRVLRMGGSRQSMEDLERAGILTLRVGRPRLELAGGAESLLPRLGVGRPLAAYWARVRLRFSITPR